MASPDFIILIDALRHDYIREGAMPFLSSLLPKSLTAEVIETFAFQTRPAFFAGLEPDESGICHLYEFNAAASPFSFLKPITGLLRQWDPSGEKRRGRGLLRRVAKALESSRGNGASAAVMSASEIPLHLLPYFALAEREFTDAPDVFAPRKTLFDLLRTKGRTWSWIGYPRHFGSTKSILAAYEKAAPSDVYYLHFSELDWIGHRFGPDTREREEACRALDRTIEQLLVPFLERGSRLVLFGDHGMVTVTGSVDLLSPLSALPFVPGRDYVPFIDSTQARFQFFNDSARKSILSLLEGMPNVLVLSDDDRRSLGIGKHRDRFGETIAVVEGTRVFHPSYFSHAPAPPRGMHGYRPDILDNRTRILLHPHVAEDIGTIPMTRIFQLTTDHLQLV